MKKYPKALADVAVLKDVLDYLYRQAEYSESEAERYAEQIKAAKEAEDEPRWYEENMVEHKAKAEAYVRLAERLAK